MLYTAIPFGYAFIILGLLAMFISGMWLLITDGKHISSIRKPIGLLLLVGAPSLLIIDSCQNAKLEWNPTLGKDTVIGSYADKHQTLTLQGDATYSLKSDTKITSGTWSLYDWNLNLADSNSRTTLQARIITYSGRPYVMLNQPEDLDMWDGSLGLKRTDSITFTPTPTPQPVPPHSYPARSSRFIVPVPKYLDPPL